MEPSSFLSVEFESLYRDETGELASAEHLVVLERELALYLCRAIEMHPDGGLVVLEGTWEKLSLEEKDYVLGL